MPKIYTSAKALALTTGMTLLTSNLKLVLTSSGYTFNIADQFLSSVPAGARVATSGNLASKSVTGGVFTAANVLYSALTGSVVTAAVLYIDSGVDATSQLIAYIDNLSGLPYTPVGVDVTVIWNASGIIRLLDAV